MNIDKTIFKAYDIRGVYPEQLDEVAAFNVGRALASLLRREMPDQLIKIAVGGDMRTSTPALKKQLLAGLSESGINVDDVGLVSTPTFYYAVAKYNYDGGVQVSASHNPAEYNGFKIVRRGGVAMGGETGIKELARIILEEDYVPRAGKKGLISTTVNMTDGASQEYLQVAGNPKIKKFKIVIDTANAMGALDYEALFAKVPCEIVKMNFELDGTFPSHEADPLKPDNTADLQAKVLSEKADLGIAADGDNDRVFIIDEKGQRVPSPILYTILAKTELLQHPGSTLAYEIRLGMIIKDEFESKGVSLVPTPVGHSLEKQIMLDHDAVFGGEISGHYFFKFPFGTFEAPSLLVIKLLEYLTKKKKPLSEIVAPFDRYFSSGEINTKVESREVIEQKISEIKNKYSDGNQILLDGVKVEYSDFWFSLRASNTEPVMRLIVEARNQKLMEEKRDELMTLLQA